MSKHTRQVSRRVLGALLAALILLSLLPTAALAVTISAPGASVVTLQESYQLANGVTETDVFLNDVNGNAQTAGYMTTVSPGAKATFKASYCGYYAAGSTAESRKEAADLGISYDMQSAPAQANAYMAATGGKVIAATNGDYYNMRTAQPLGTLVMEGNLIQMNNGSANEPYFAVLKDGSFVMREAGTDASDVQEAISGPFFLVKNGKVCDGLGSEKIPVNSISMKADGTVFTFLSDGRQVPYSTGMTLPELAEFLVAQGAQTSIYLDGGGSATIATVREGGSLTVRNRPSDGVVRNVASALLLVATADETKEAFIYEGGVVKSSVTGNTVPDYTGWAQLGQTQDKLYFRNGAYLTGWQSAENKLYHFAPNGVVHNADATCLYDGTNLICPKCSQQTSKDGYTGWVTVKDSANKKYLSGGNEWTGWHQIGSQTCHFGSDGVQHATTTVDRRTCTMYGQFVTTCACGETNRSVSQWPVGHDWDANHVCTKCGFHGIDIATCKIELANSIPLGESGNLSWVRVTDEARNKQLTVKTTDANVDGYLLYESIDGIGTAGVKIHGMGNYYGLLTAKYLIVPHNVTELTVSDVTKTGATFNWTSATGAECYILAISKDGGKSWENAAEVNGTSYVLTGLAGGRTYSFRVYGCAKADGLDYLSANSSPVREISLPADIKLVENDGKQYLFLPSYMSLAEVPESYFAQEGSFTLTGGFGSSAVLDGNGTVDLTKLAERGADGIYSITVKADGKQDMTVNVMKSTAVNTMFLTSDDPETQGIEYVDASKSNEVTGKMLLCRSDGTVVYDGKLKQLKARGNTTFTNADKKSYQIKLADKTDLTGNGGKGKTWVLLAGFMDATFMHDKMFKDLAETLKLAYTPSADWTDLYYDGAYRGTYLISEKASVGSSTVDVTDMEDAYTELNEGYGDDMNVQNGTNSYGQTYLYTAGLTEPEDITGGYLIELRKPAIDEANGFNTTHEGNFNLRSPEFCGQEAMNYISQYYQEFEDAVYAEDHSGYNATTGKYYYEYCDLESLVKIYLIEELANNVDGFYSSFYFYKDAGQIMYAGPVWDMDSTCGTGWEGVISASANFVYKRYLAEALTKIPSFMAAVNNYYNSTFRAASENLLGAEGVIAKYTKTLQNSAAMNYILWPFLKYGKPNSEDVSANRWADGTTYADVLTSFNNWMQTRTGKLTERFSNLVTHHDAVAAGVCTDGTIEYWRCLGKNFSDAACKKEVTELTIPAPHQWNEGTVTKEPTATEDGEKLCTCELCGATKTVVVPSLSHVHAYTDTVTDPTCTEKGYTKHTCSCGDSYIDTYTDALGHAYIDTLTAPTCTEKGYTTHTCSRCSNSYIDAETDALGHAYTDTVTAPTCTEKGYTTHTCNSCGDSYTDADMAALGHAWDEGVVTKAATTSEIGEMLYTCTRCGKTRTETIAKLIPCDGGNGCPGKAFTDMPAADNWAHEGIDYVLTKKLFEGTSKTAFSPNATMTRAMLVTVLWRAEGSPEVGTNTFKDVPDGQWYTKAVTWAAQAKVVDGVGDSKFNPDGKLTREQLATILYRYSVSKSLDVTARGELSAFPDSSKVSSWADDAVQWAVAEKLIGGVARSGKDYLDPQSSATREQVATILMRYLRK